MDDGADVGAGVEVGAGVPTSWELTHCSFWKTKPSKQEQDVAEILELEWTGQVMQLSCPWRFWYVPLAQAEGQEKVVSLGENKEEKRKKKKKKKKAGHKPAHSAPAYPGAHWVHKDPK